MAQTGHDVQSVEETSPYNDTAYSTPYDGEFTLSPLSHMSNGSRPSSQHSGSDYSQPQTPDQSRPSSMQAFEDAVQSPSAFEEVSLNSRPNSYNPAVNSPRTSYPSQRQSGTNRPRTPPEPRSPEGSNYSGSPHPSQRGSGTPTIPVSPITPHEAHMSINSLQSIALSEIDYDYVDQPNGYTESTPETTRVARHSRKPSGREVLENVWSTSWPSTGRRPTLTRPAHPTRQSTLFDISKEQPSEPTTPTNDAQLQDESEGFEQDGDIAVDQSTEASGPSLNVVDDSSIWRTKRFSSLGAPTRVPTLPAEDDLELDWGTLDRTEEQEKEDKEIPEGEEDDSTRFLLARLEQENAKLTTDFKSSITNKAVGRLRSQTRPPSMAHLKKLVSQDAPSIRYSLVSDGVGQLPEEPPPMTELEYWAAIVQDYPSTASRLPTLTSTKIRAGIPPPLRGVVWTSMAGARDKDLEEAFERLKDEESPYEGIINKDVGRSFPGVELFRDAEGEGQKMLGRVLKCFSLHDKDIGYCQGLGFLVGPLLMNMGEKDAFCVLVRLMEHYALRPSFLPSLSGLHMRIYQFGSLLRQHHPQLSEHLAVLGVEPAYLSQWFLSCFAVTCPLPMLFRIYDVIFAEGANETVMRVALALFRRNEEKMMASTEFEDVMQLLLGRALWDVYGCNADDLVDDFTSLGNIITHVRLSELEREFESKDGDSVGQSAGFLPDVQAAASRFLGRLWAPNQGLTPSKGAVTSLSPASAEKDASPYGYLARPSTFLRRTASKQDLATGNDSTSSESSGSASTASTALTDSEIHDSTARESQADSMSMKSKPESMLTVSGSTSAHAQQMATLADVKEQELQSEIEDLLMALSEMQREHAQMVAMLQREREERSDDHRVVKQLLNKLTNGQEEPKTNARRSMPPPPRPNSQGSELTTLSEKRRTLPARPIAETKSETEPQERLIAIDESDMDEIGGLVNGVQSRLESNARFSASFETRAQLRSTLARTREQLTATEAQVKDLSERAESSETSLAYYEGENESLLAEAEELRTRVNEDFKEKKKLELMIENMQIQMRMEAKAVEKKQRSVELARSELPVEPPLLRKAESPNRSRTGSLSSNPGTSSGLRELKLCRRESVASVSSIRSLKSQRNTEDEWPRPNPPAFDTVASPPRSPTTEVPPPTPPAYPTIPQSSSLTVPEPSGPHFARRTTSLAAREVFATSQHEPVPEDALLLELVNAKTAEATARQEVDELKKSMQTQKRRADESLLELQAAITSAQLEAENARDEAEQARLETKAARAEVFDASEMSTPMTPAVSFPLDRRAEYAISDSPTPPAISTSPVEQSDPKPPESATTGFGGWFWNKRSPSASKPTLSGWMEGRSGSS